ncbi:hypothetical protein IEQ34_025281 [Dendrobium chrysotoxum]|uniref:Small ribosomal subunit protein uS17 n=1 Tax=Dendrobium chrysotoxum TaxID=161865 RepID=A0AAV7FRH2_DENCH|nr:hypothetical protein IEQ34_025281 [Dendrobium chrysotoxum]
MPRLSSLTHAALIRSNFDLEDRDKSTTTSTTATMATELTVQSERAFQKQPHIFLNHKSKAASQRELERVAEDGSRTLAWASEPPRLPSMALTLKCPFTGMVSIRGRILTGKVISTKMHRTVVIRREYLHFIPKYARYEKRHSNLAAHVSPAFRVEEGDTVTVGQCRPLSKTVRGHVPHSKPSTDQVTGTIQRSPCIAPKRKGCQVILQVLSVAHEWNGLGKGKACSNQNTRCKHNDGWSCLWGVSV